MRIKLHFSSKEDLRVIFNFQHLKVNCSLENLTLPLLHFGTSSVLRNIEISGRHYEIIKITLLSEFKILLNFFHTSIDLFLI